MGPPERAQLLKQQYFQPTYVYRNCTRLRLFLRL